MIVRQAAFMFSAVATLVFFGIVAALAGCAEFNAVQAAIADHGAQAADSVLRTNKWGVCQAATIGALERELGSDSTRILGWLMFCGKKPDLLPLLAPPVPSAKSQVWQPVFDNVMREVSF
jgi:hypothetical protein